MRPRKVTKDVKLPGLGRPKGQVIICPNTSPARAHFYPFVFRGTGEITLIGHCVYCGKKYGG